LRQVGYRHRLGAVVGAVSEGARVVLWNVILPVFLITAGGFVIGRVSRLEPGLLLRVAFYLLGPALIFRSIYTAEIDSSHIVTICGFVAVLSLLLYGVSRLFGRAFGWDEETQAAGSLVMTFGNYGTYGLPVLLFAFGEEAFALGIVVMVFSNLLQATVGVGISSWRRGMALRVWLSCVARVPWLYAMLLGILFRAVGCEIPLGVWRGIDLLADAAIPVHLILLGVQLSRSPLRVVTREALWLSAAKLVVPPLLAAAIVWGFRIDGILASVLLVESSMPSAINSLILSMRYNRRPELAASVVFWTTLVSLGTISLMLSLLRGF
jgi:hypothetical protein